MKYSFLKLSILVITVSAFMAGCYPGGPEFVEDYDVVYTFDFDPSIASDKSKKLYFLPDTIVDLSDPDNSPPAKGNAAAVLAEIRTKLAELGYVQETDINKVDSTDFIFLASASRSNNYVATWWPSWGWWPGWGWGGCCYYPPTTVSNFRTGSLIIQMIHTEDLDENEENIPVVWQGTLDGLFEGSSQNITSRASRGVDQMFNQSPYLNRN